MKKCELYTEKYTIFFHSRKADDNNEREKKTERKKKQRKKCESREPNIHCRICVAINFQ